jgi:hypothetical protein
MDEGVLRFLTVLAAVAFSGLIGAVFGGLAGWLAWRDGRPSGTALGLAVARIFARESSTGLSPGARGLYAGAADGFAFLGLIGFATAAVVVQGKPAAWVVLTTLGAGLFLLAAAAVLFGLTARRLISRYDDVEPDD